MVFCKQMEIKTISILGCGWFGLAFAKALVANNYIVKGSTTQVDKLVELEHAGVSAYILDLNKEGCLPSEFFLADVLVVAIPPRAKTGDAKEYEAKMEKVAIEAAVSSIKQVIFISSTGVFEDGNFVVDEDTIAQPDTTSAIVLQAAENVFKNHSEFTTTIVRFGGLLGLGRNLARFFAGKLNAPNGDAPINLIELQDCIGLNMRLLQTQQFGGIYHAVTPHHPTRAEFYTRLCEVSGIDKPTFKSEKLSWKQVNSVNVPQRLGYEFIINNWFKWLDGNPVL